jgi:hypothetical protein
LRFHIVPEIQSIVDRDPGPAILIFNQKKFRSAFTQGFD